MIEVTSAFIIGMICVVLALVWLSDFGPRLLLATMWLCIIWATPLQHSNHAINSPPVLPDEFIFISATVQEPFGNYPGRIWIWARSKEDPLTPISYDLPYDKEAADVVQSWVKIVNESGSELGVKLLDEDAAPVQPQPQEKERSKSLKVPDERSA